MKKLKPLEETITIRQPVPSRIADLVNFTRSLEDKDIRNMSDDDLIKAARDFWETYHGED